eukprot:COSAG03_NODE_404_length_8183_cov_12.238619_2_plen_49_part_00
MRSLGQLLAEILLLLLGCPSPATALVARLNAENFHEVLEKSLRVFPVI